MELVAFSKCYCVDIAVHQIEQDTWIIYSGAYDAKLIHIAYYSWEHYSSVRPLEGAQIPAFKNEVDEKAVDIEKQIMKMTGKQDVEKIRGLMKHHKGNFNAVINQLYENMNNEDSHFEEDAVDLNAQETVEIKSKPNPDNTKETKVKRLSAREKKDLAKKKQKEASKQKKKGSTTKISDPPVIDNVIEKFKIVKI